MSEFGSGIYLTSNDDIGPNWDIQVDETGDIRSSNGIDELQKDAAYASAVILSGQIGERLSPAVLNRIKSRVRDALVDEERIETILLIEANVPEENDTVEVVAKVNANGDEIELVIEVDT